MVNDTDIKESGFREIAIQGAIGRLLAPKFSWQYDAHNNHPAIQALTY